MTVLYLFLGLIFFALSAWLVQGLHSLESKNDENAP